MNLRSHFRCLGAAIVFSACVPTPTVLADASDCPPTLLSVRQQELHQDYGADLAVSSVVYDSTISVGYGQAHFTFDHSLATLSSSVACSGWFFETVRVVERFDVVGVPAGTPVSATLLYDVDLFGKNCALLGCGYSYYASLVCGPDSVIANATNITIAGNEGYSGTLSLPVTFIAGTPLEAAFSINSYTFRFADGVELQGRGHYGVTGLPPGVRAVSCYQTDVTPVRSRTWGALKVTYR